MKVEVNSQALADAVAWTTRVIDARPASPILAMVFRFGGQSTAPSSFPAFNSRHFRIAYHIEAGVR